MPDKYTPTGAVFQTVSNGLRPESLEIPHRDQRAPTVNDVIYPIGKFWIDLSEEDLWFLNNFYYTSGRLQANWVKFGGPALVELNVQFSTSPGVDPVEPTTTGVLTLDGAIVANGTNASQPLATHTRALNTANLELQLGTTVSPTPADTVDVGVFSANEDHFTVDATSGMLSIKGGAVTPPVSKVDVDFNTAPGVDPVVSTVAGVITHSGNVVSNATNANAPVATHSRAVNSYTTEVQVAAAVTGAPGDKLDVGLSSYDDVLFQVDADGYVETQTTTNADLIIGNTARGTGKIGTLKSTDGSVTITYDDPDIDLSASAPPAEPSFKNVGFSYSGSTFTMHSADGTAFSASNPGIIYLQDRSNFGQLVKYTVEENQTFVDASGSSDIIGNTFGLTSGTAYASDVPFYIYAMGNDNEDTITFALSRIPHRVVAPAAGNIATSSSAVASTQGSFYALEDSGGPITVGDYDGNPSLVLGSFRMQMDSSDDWTVQALSSDDGIGHYQEDVQFTFLRGTFGNASSSYMDDLSGTVTAPTFGSNTFNYSVKKNGYVRYNIVSGDATGGGTGASSITFNTPFVLAETSFIPNATHRPGNPGTAVESCWIEGTASSKQLKNLRDYSGGIISYTSFTSNREFTFHFDSIPISTD